VEFTGGSTGSSLAFVGAVKGYPLSFVTSDAFALEKLRTVRAFGADTTVVPAEGGAIPPGLFTRMRREVDRLVVREGPFGPTSSITPMPSAAMRTSVVRFVSRPTVVARRWMPSVHLSAPLGCSPTLPHRYARTARSAPSLWTRLPRPY
jgi:hypothetical protein